MAIIWILFRADNPKKFAEISSSSIPNFNLLMCSAIAFKQNRQ